MATRNCRWLQISMDAAPGVLFSIGTGADGAPTIAVNKSAVIDAGSALTSNVVSLGEQSLLLQALRDWYLQSGEDQADADAAIDQSSVYFGSDKGVTYGIIDVPSSGIYVFKQVCGAMLNLLYILGGAALLGLGGYAWAKRKGKGGGKGKVATTVAVALLAGGVSGYVLSRLMTDSASKAYEKMGLLSVRKMGLIDAQRTGLLDVRMGTMGRTRRTVQHLCPKGMFWSAQLRRCVRPL